jgi:predicted nuclease of predicted toxin-antitoxin system
MRLLLDENVPRKLTLDLRDYQVMTVPEMGWSGIKNGELLKQLIKEKIDCFITADKNIEFQQNFKKYPIPVIIIKVKRITYPNIKTIVPEMLKLIEEGLQPGINFIE